MFRHLAFKHFDCLHGSGLRFGSNPSCATPKFAKQLTLEHRLAVLDNDGERGTLIRSDPDASHDVLYVYVVEYS